MLGTGDLKSILLLGGSGYVGGAFRRLFAHDNVDCISVARRDHDYTDRDTLIRLIRDVKPDALINCAGYTGKPNVDACELYKTDCLAGNAVLPGVISEACQACDLPWGHVSSGCIYTGARPDGSGFTEDDKPNFSFRTDNCSFYSGTKALGEETLASDPTVYIWRLRVPFNHIDSGRNYLSKLMRYERLLDATNSLSHLDDFARCCFECLTRQVPTGVYNVTNTGAVSAREVVPLIKEHLSVEKTFTFFDSEEEFMRLAATTPRSNCVLSNDKLKSVGIQIRDVRDAIADSLANWHPETTSAMEPSK